MAIAIDRTADNGDGTVTVYAATPGRNYVHVVVGHDLLMDGTVYDMLTIAAAKQDARADALAIQAEHDTQE